MNPPAGARGFGSPLWRELELVGGMVLIAALTLFVGLSLVALAAAGSTPPI